MRLLPYQDAGVAWLIGRKCALLADEMGLGKSAQVIRAADACGMGRVLIVCPAIARIGWLREFQKWSSVERGVAVFHKHRDPLPLSPIVSFDFAAKHTKMFLSGGVTWDLLVVDEAHFAKSTDAKRSKALFGVGGIAHRARRVWALSGTPAPNNASELWILLFTFGVTRLSFAQFVERYCDTIPDNFGVQITGTKASAIPELRDEVLPKIMLRRLKRDVMKDLPPVTISRCFVSSDPTPPLLSDRTKGRCQNGIEHDFSCDDIAKMKVDEQRVFDALDSRGDQMAMLEALAPSISTLRRYCGLQKISAAVALIASELELGLYQKIVVFAIHREVLLRIADRLREKRVRVKLVQGGVTQSMRQASIDRFQDPDSGLQVFMGNIQAAGTAISLTAASNVLFVEQEWVPGHNAQAIARVARMGQKLPVFVRLLTRVGSIDERVNTVLEKKIRELTNIFD